MQRSRILFLAALLTCAGATSAQTCVPTTTRIAGAEGIGLAVGVTPRSDGAWRVFSTDPLGQLTLRTCDEAGACDSGSAYAVTNAPQSISALAATTLPNGMPQVAFRDATSQRIGLGRCTDIGCSYSTSRVLEPARPAGQRAPAIAPGADGFARVAYEQQDGATSTLRLYTCATGDCASGGSLELDATRTDTHTSIALVNNGGGAHNVLLYDAAADSSTRVLACTNADCSMHLAATLVAGSAAVIAPRAGNGYDVAYTRAGGGLGLLRCEDATCALRSERTLVASATLGQQPQALRRADGTLAITHRDGGAQLRLYLCDDATCSTGNDRIVADHASASTLGIAADGRVIVFVRSAISAMLRAVRCDSAGCATQTTRSAFNGSDVSYSDVVVRPDGRPAAIYVRDFSNGDELWVHDCADAACSSGDPHLVATNSNFGTAPRALLRNDGRVGVLAGFYGGAAFLDCVDAACSTALFHQVTPAGSGTGDQLAATLRPDGRPAFALLDRSFSAGASRNDVLLYQCADANCTAGTQRTLVDLGGSASVLDLAIAADGGNRLRVSYAYTDGAVQGIGFAACDDVGCSTSVTRSTLPPAQFSFGVELGIRADGRPWVFDSNGSTAALRDCSDASCSSNTPVPLGAGLGFGTRMLLDADVPAFGAVNGSQLLRADCVGANCATQVSTPLGDAPGTSLVAGGFTLGPDGAALVAGVDSTERDLWLGACGLAPLPPAIFANGFED